MKFAEFVPFFDLLKILQELVSGSIVQEQGTHSDDLSEFDKTWQLPSSRSPAPCRSSLLIGGAVKGSERDLVRFEDSLESGSCSDDVGRARRERGIQVEGRVSHVAIRSCALAGCSSWNWPLAPG